MNVVTASLERKIAEGGPEHDVFAPVPPRLLVDTPKQSLHRVPRRFAHLGLDVPVGRQGEGDRRMAEHLAHHQRLHALQK